jgi:hypothetical protein
MGVYKTMQQQMDKVIFGDNQFFGINHMSQEKAQQLAEQFYDSNAIYQVYDTAFEAGIKAVMLNSNDRAQEICDYFRINENKYHDISWYPSIPYPYKYANLVAEKGIFPAIGEVLFKNNSAANIFNMVAKGSMAVLGKDVIKMMQMLIDTEMRMFRDLHVKTIFLQNIITDLMLGYGIKEIFYEYCEYIRKKYDVLPGFITQNMPYLLQKLKQWNIAGVAVCFAFNKIGYLMSPDVKSYIETANNNSSDDYQLMAMCTLASGAIPAKEAYQFINQQNIQSVVFGASSRKHIEETIKLIQIK